MAITAANLTADTSTTAGPYTTASVAFANNKLYLVSVWNRIGTTQVDVSSITGGGLTWVQVLGDGTLTRCEVWRGLVTSGATTGALTITMSAAPARVAWSIDEFTGVDTSGANGSGAVVQSAASSGTATTLSVTLAAFGDAVNNAAFGSFLHRAQETSTVEAGYTALSNSAYGAVSSLGTMAEWKVGQDTTVSASWTTSAAAAAVAVEIKMAPAGGGPWTVPANIALETDAALAVTASKDRAVGLASESDSAFAIAVSRSLLLGIASEVDAPLVILASKDRAIGLGTELDAALAILGGLSPIVAGTADMRLLHRFTAELEAALYHTAGLEVIDRYTAEMAVTEVF